MKPNYDEYEKAGIKVVHMDATGRMVYATDMNKRDEYCDSCPHLLFEPDPDPTDWFRDDNQKAICEALNMKIYGSLEHNELTNIKKPLYCPKFGRPLTEEEQKEAKRQLEIKKALNKAKG